MLEFRYPVVLEDFHIRKDSGGKGKWHAGDGIRRTIRFLEKMDCTVLSGHRRVPPFGLAGGAPGQPGRNWVERVDGTRDEKGATARWEVNPGDVFVIETPGGGGYGAPRST